MAELVTRKLGLVTHAFVGKYSNAWAGTIGNIQKEMMFSDFFVILDDAISLINQEADNE